MDAEAIKLVTEGGPLGVLLMFVIGLVRGWWVTAGHYREITEQYRQRLDDAEKRAAEWKELARAGAMTAQRAVDVAATSGATRQ